MTEALPVLREGEMYRVVFRSSGLRTDAEMIAEFVMLDTDTGELVFSLPPRAGTHRLHREQVTSIEAMPGHAPMVPRRAQ
jgi:hypothetical protein